MSEKRKIAIVGGGVAGIVAAWRLQKRYDVSIFESGKYLGGHTNTVVIDRGIDRGVSVDTGFIVLNDKTYPKFTKFLKELEVSIRYADMSFSVNCPKLNLQYCSRDLNVLFAQRRNFFNPRFLKMLLEIKRFWHVGSDALNQNKLGDLSVADFLSKNNFSSIIKEDFLYPLAAAVWSSSDKQLDAFPALTFLSFFRNHGWLSYYDQPRWQTVVGGSHQYVRQFLAKFGGEVVLESPVSKIAHVGGKQELRFADGRCRQYDQVVLAVHADQVLDLLKDPSEEEIQIFSKWKYSNNYTILHTDPCYMPPLKRAWGAWNYRKEECDSSQPVSVTYYMNLLQGLKANNNYFVTLNPRFEPKDQSIIREFNYTHPIFTADSVSTQRRLQEYNGRNGRWYCGSYCGYGFHEDAVKSSEFICEKILV